MHPQFNGPDAVWWNHTVDTNCTFSLSLSRISMFRFRTKCGAHIVLCPECWLLTKAGTSFCRRGMALCCHRMREKECRERNKTKRQSLNHSHSLYMLCAWLCHCVLCLSTLHFSFRGVFFFFLLLLLFKFWLLLPPHAQNPYHLPQHLETRPRTTFYTWC